MAGSAGAGQPLDVSSLSANKRWAVLAVMSLSVFMVFVDGTVVNTALPAISRDLEATTAELQWVADGYILLLAGLLLVGGSIGDRYGRRRFLALGMVIFRRRRDRSGALHERREPRRVSRAAGSGGGADPPGDTVDLDRRLSSQRARAGNRRLDRRRRARRGRRAGAGRLSGGRDRLERRVLAAHPGCRGGADRAAGRARLGGTRATSGWTAPGAVLATGGLIALVFAIIQGNEAGWLSAPEIVPRLRARDRVPRLVRLRRAEVRAADAAAAVLPAARLHGRRDRDRARVLRDVRRHLLPHAVLPARAGPIGVPLRAADRARGARDDDQLAARGPPGPDHRPEAPGRRLDVAHPLRDGALHPARYRYERASTSSSRSSCSVSAPASACRR